MIVLSKVVALELINRGFLVSDIQVSKKDGKPVYEFESSEEFNKVFSEILFDRKYLKINFMRQEIKLLIKCLSSQSVINRMENNSSENGKIEKLIDYLNFHLNRETDINSEPVDVEPADVEPADEVKEDVV